ncbi:MAG: WG repeat-containing protein [Bacteroidota bacterium]
MERPVIYFTEEKVTGYYFLDSNFTITGDYKSYYYFEGNYDMYLILETSKNKVGMWTLGGEKIIDPKYDNLGYYEYETYEGQSYILTKNAGKYGLINQLGEIIFEAEYQEIYTLETGINDAYYYAVKKNSKYGIADKNGKIILPVEFDYFDEIAPWYPVKKDGKYGYLNDSLQLEILCQFENADPFDQDSLAIVKFDGKYGVINRQGKYIINPEYEDFLCCVDDKIFAKNKGLWGLMNLEGKWLVEPIYYDIRINWNNSMPICFLKKKEKWGLFDYEQIKEMGLFNYDKITTNYSTPYIVVLRDNKYGYLNKEYTEIIPCEYEFLSQYVENNLILAKKNGKTGFIDISNKTVIPFEFDDADDFSYGYTSVCKNKKWAIADTTGKVLMSFQYDEIKTINDIQVVARIGKKYGVVDHSGEIVYPFEYDYIDQRSTEYYFTKGKDESGYLPKK